MLQGKKCLVASAAVRAGLLAQIAGMAAPYIQPPGILRYNQRIGSGGAGVRRLACGRPAGLLSDYFSAGLASIMKEYTP
jgi:hypothetical protein